MKLFDSLLICSALVLFAPGAFAASSGQPVQGTNSVSTGYQQLTSLSASTGFTPPAKTTYCNFVPTIQGVVYRTDGVAPTVAIGMPLGAGVPLTLRMSIANLEAVRFIAASAGAILNIDCYYDQ